MHKPPTTNHSRSAELGDSDGKRMSLEEHSTFLPPDWLERFNLLDNTSATKLIDLGIRLADASIDNQKQELLIRERLVETKRIEIGATETLSRHEMIGSVIGTMGTVIINLSFIAVAVYGIIESKPDVSIVALLSLAGAIAASKFLGRGGGQSN